jgi:flavin reductase (DIM6/NTAB) family NADH-FMN oxidoreductase RutF
LRDAVNRSAEQVPYGTDEFTLANVTKEKGSVVNVPMVKESPVKFECKYLQSTHLPGDPPMGSVDVSAECAVAKVS